MPPLPRVIPQVNVTVQYRWVSPASFTPTKKQIGERARERAGVSS